MSDSEAADSEQGSKPSDARVAVRARALEVRSFVPELDGLRCYAFLFVFLGHVFFGTFPVAWIGVDIFFVISGFLITRILLHEKSGPRYFKNFYARRTVRVFPIYYLLLFLVFWGIPRLFPDQPIHVYPDWTHKYYFFYVQNLGLNMLRDGDFFAYLGHTWSLAIEEQYYLVWPFVVLFLSPKKLGWLCAAIVVTCPTLRWLLYEKGVYEHHALLVHTPWEHGFSHWQIYKNTFMRIDGVALGSLIAVVVQQRWLSLVVFRRLSVLLTLTALPAALIVIWETEFFPLMLEKPPRWQVVWIYPLVAFGFAGVIGVLLVVRAAPIRWLFANPVFTYVGKISYGLYVFHWPLHVVLDSLNHEHRLPAWLGRFPGWLTLGVATLGIAMLSWHLFERPLLKLKNRFRG